MILLLVTALLFADGDPHLVFSKSFPGSNPAYIEISIEKSCAGVYKEDPKDENPVTFQLGADECPQYFTLAEKLGHFTREVESGLKVAKMGQKTFRYEAGAEKHEVEFNYSVDADARALTDLFEQIAETERAFINLERAVKFDKIGAQDAILRLEVLRDQKRLAAPEQFLPLLDRVVKNESFLHMARDRAAALAEGIRKPK